MAFAIVLSFLKVPTCARNRAITVKLVAHTVEVELMHGWSPEPAAHGASDGKCPGEVQLRGQFAVDGVAEVAVMLVTYSRTEHDLFKNTQIMSTNISASV